MEPGKDKHCFAAGIQVAQGQTDKSPTKQTAHCAEDGIVVDATSIYRHNSFSLQKRERKF